MTGRCVTYKVNRSRSHGCFEFFAVGAGITDLQFPVLTITIASSDANLSHEDISVSVDKSLFQ